MKNRGLVTIFLLLLSADALALYQDILHTNSLKITVKNNTSYDCHLVDADIYKGIDQSTYKTILKSGEHTEFILIQYYTPIAYFFSYSCNGKTISIRNYRNTSILWAGKTKGYVVDSLTDHGISAHLDEIDRGSAFLGTYAHINWSIHLDH